MSFVKHVSVKSVVAALLLCVVSVDVIEPVTAELLDRKQSQLRRRAQEEQLYVPPQAEQEQPLMPPQPPVEGSQYDEQQQLPPETPMTPNVPPPEMQMSSPEAQTPPPPEMQSPPDFVPQDMEQQPLLPLDTQTQPYLPTEVSPVETVPTYDDPSALQIQPEVETEEQQLDQAFDMNTEQQLQGAPTSNKLAGSGSFGGEYGDCIVPRVEKRPVPPSFVASYPGSGAKLTWKLIRAVTGLMTGDDYDHNGSVAAGWAVAIKTHYPSHSNPDLVEPLKPLVDRVVILIRHPVNSIPSYHNYIYEKENDLRNHSTRAPVEAWLRWRDANFFRELQLWHDQVTWWMEEYPSPESRVIISYEHLTSHEHGPKALIELTAFLSQVKGVETVHPAHLPCIWDHVVNVRSDVGTRRDSLREGPRTVYPYQQPHLAQTASVLHALKGRWPEELGALMDEYTEQLAGAALQE